METANEQQVIRVVVVDDDPFVVASLATILGAEKDVEVVGRGTSGEEAVALYEELAPDVLLTDIQMPGCDGLVAAERVLAAHPDANVVFLTTFSDDEYIVRALRLGACGYLIKQEVATIAPALRSVVAGQSVLGEKVVERMNSLVARPGTTTETVRRAPFADPRLTERECAVVEMVADGLDNREIAERLYLSEGTVRNHISSVLQKLGLRNRTQIAVHYYRTRG